MLKHGASLRSRLVVAFLATALFVVPAAAQTIIIGYDRCWLRCHKLTKYRMEINDWTLEEAQDFFLDCMNGSCGGMGEAS